MNSKYKHYAEWEGVIEEVFDTYFSAQIYDLLDSADDSLIEYIEVENKKIKKEERDHIGVGRIFNWKIYGDSEDSMQSEIVFYKYKWTAEELAAAKEKAKEFSKFFKE